MHVLFALTIQSFAGLLLLLSAGSKLRDTVEFERVLGAYEILPSPLLRPTALLLPLLELALAAGLLLRVGDTISAWLGAGLLVVFAQWLQARSRLFPLLLTETERPVFTHVANI